jgi:ubiquinone/menaquinone biosynthesis C-methylase UbiE
VSEGLHAASRFYGSQVELYQRFSQAEDAPGKVAALLRPRAAGRDVLDVGCGTGKYLALLAGAARRYVGVDLSAEALEIARLGAPAGAEVTLLCGSAEKIDLPDNSVDFSFATWVLGTILEEERRGKVLAECIRVLRSGGEMLLVENDVGGEFEEIRGRSPDASRTRAYNCWLEAHGFRAIERCTTHFQFSSADEAREVLGSIWGESCAVKVKYARIEQRLVIYGAARRDIRGGDI